MLLDAIHLTPDSETVAWMKENAPTDDFGEIRRIYAEAIRYERPLADQSGVAGRSGMVVPDDYNGNFRPEKAIARYEIALMTDRALAWYTRPVSRWGELPFTDKEEILDWMKGYVNESVKAGVLKVSDRSFQPNKTSMRARLW